MRRFLLILTVSAISFDGIVPSIAAQAPIRCVNNWSAASFSEPLVRALAADIARSCADSGRIPWDQHLSEIGPAIAAWSWDAKMSANLRTMQRMLQQERDHLRAERARQAASAPAPPGGSRSSGRLPVGNDWSLDNTISGLRPITGLSEIQRRWADDNARTVGALKPLGAAGNLPTTNDPAGTEGLPAKPKSRGNATWIATDPATPSRTTAPGAAPPAAPAGSQAPSRTASVAADPARPPERTPQNREPTPAQAGASRPSGLALPTARSTVSSGGPTVVDLSGVRPGSVIRQLDEPPDIASAAATRRTTPNSAGEPAFKPLPATGGAAGGGPPRKRPGAAAAADDEYGKDEEERAAIRASNMVPAHVRGLCEVARERNEYLVFQTTSPATRRNLQNGYIPKPMEVKVKTAPDDGGPAPGLIPARPEHNRRAGDPEKYREAVRKHTSPGPMGSDPLATIVAVPDARDPSRSVLVLADYRTRRPFTADYDLATVGRRTLRRVIQHDVEGQLSVEDRALLRDIEQKLGVRVAQHGPATMAPTVDSAEIKYPLTVCDPTGRVSTIHNETAFRKLTNTAAATGHAFWGWRWRAEKGEPDAAASRH